MLIIPSLGWEFITGVGIFIGFIASWGYYLFYKYFLKHEDELKKKIENDVNRIMIKYASIKKESGVEGFVNDVSYFVEFQKILDVSKDIFEKYILIGGAALIILAFSLVIFQNTTIFTWMVAGSTLLTAIIFNQFYQLYKNKNDIEKYLRGKSPKEILGEDYFK